MMMDLVSRLEKLAKRRDMRAFCMDMMPLARRSTPLTTQEKDVIINKRGVYRTCVAYKNKSAVDSVIEELFKR